MEDDIYNFIDYSLNKINNLKYSNNFTIDAYKEKITKYLNRFITKYDCFNGYLVYNDFDLDKKPYCKNMIVDIIVRNDITDDNYIYIFFSKFDNEFLNKSVVNTFKSKYRGKLCYLISYDFKNFIKI